MIRLATEADVPEILDIYGPYILTTTYTFEYDVPTQEEFLDRFRTITKKFPWLVWEEEGMVLGYAYAGAPWERAAYRWCAEVSIYLHPSIHGRGIGRELYAVLEDILTKQGYRVAYALITTENQGSVAFHEKLGYSYHSTFENCGYKMGRWLGVIWLQKRLNENGNPGEFPKKWQDVIK